MSDGGFWMATFEEHGTAVLSFLTRRTGHRDVAEDLLQETFLRAMRARPTLPDPKGVRSYLFATAHHLLITKSRKKRPIPFSQVTEHDTAALERVPDAGAAAPDAAAELSRFAERLHDVLEGLTPPARTAFQEAVLNQKPYSEIAREQGWSIGTVKSNVHRARKKIIAALGGLLGPRPESHR